MVPCCSVRVGLSLRVIGGRGTEEGGRGSGKGQGAGRRAESQKFAPPQVTCSSEFRWISPTRIREFRNLDEGAPIYLVGFEPAARGNTIARSTT